MPEASIILATTNKGKIRELAEPLAAFGLTVLGLDAFPDLPDVEETGETFAANALLKARAAAEATGLTAVADDSGLSVEALRGQPGVRSARFWQTGDPLPGLDLMQTEALSQDARNIRKLLDLMHGTPDAQRGAYFCCAMCAVHPGLEHTVLTTEGRWHGIIAREPRGTGGFGYDPVFFDVELRRTAAEMPRETKMVRSHRGKALAALLEGWTEFWKVRKA